MNYLVIKSRITLVATLLAERGGGPRDVRCSAAVARHPDPAAPDGPRERQRGRRTSTGWLRKNAWKIPKKNA